jgi:hemerythrin superfamily protein
VTPVQEQDVIELLLSQHQRMKALFTRVRQSTGEAKQDAFHELTRLLAVHESAEEQVVHPAARDDAGDDVVEARLEEENAAKRALAELYEMGVDAPGFDERFTAFEAAVLSHAQHEEQEEFPLVRMKTEPATLVRMAGAVRAAEAVAPTRPHPNAGENPVANLIAGPPLAIFDRTRDAVRDWRRSQN